MPALTFGILEPGGRREPPQPKTQDGSLGPEVSVGSVWPGGICLGQGLRAERASTKPPHYANDHKPRARGLEDSERERLPRSAFSVDMHPIIYLAEG